MEAEQSDSAWSTVAPHLPPVDFQWCRSQLQHLQLALSWYPFSLSSLSSQSTENNF